MVTLTLALLLSSFSLAQTDDEINTVPKHKVEQFKRTHNKKVIREHSEPKKRQLKKVRDSEFQGMIPSEPETNKNRLKVLNVKERSKYRTIDSSNVYVWYRGFSVGSSISSQVKSPGFEYAGSNYNAIMSFSNAANIELSMMYLKSYSLGLHFGFKYDFARQMKGGKFGNNLGFVSLDNVSPMPELQVATLIVGGSYMLKNVYFPFGLNFNINGAGMGYQVGGGFFFNKTFMLDYLFRVERIAFDFITQNQNFSVRTGSLITNGLTLRWLF